MEQVVYIKKKGNIELPLKSNISNNLMLRVSIPIWILSVLFCITFVVQCSKCNAWVYSVQLEMLSAKTLKT